MYKKLKSSYRSVKWFESIKRSRMEPVTTLLSLFVEAHFNMFSYSNWKQHEVKSNENYLHYIIYYYNSYHIIMSVLCSYVLTELKVKNVSYICTIVQLNNELVEKTSLLWNSCSKSENNMHEWYIMLVSRSRLNYLGLLLQFVTIV